MTNQIPIGEGTTSVMNWMDLDHLQKKIVAQGFTILTDKKQGTMIAKYGEEEILRSLRRPDGMWLTRTRNDYFGTREDWQK